MGKKFISNIGVDLIGEDYVLEVGPTGLDAMVLIPNVRWMIYKKGDREFINLSDLVDYQMNKTTEDDSLMSLFIQSFISIYTNQSIDQYAIMDEAKRIFTSEEMNLSFDLKNVTIDPSKSLNMGVLSPLYLQDSFVLNAHANLQKARIDNLELPGIYSLFNNKKTIFSDDKNIFKNIDIDYSKFKENKTLILDAESIILKNWKVILGK